MASETKQSLPTPRSSLIEDEHASLLALRSSPAEEEPTPMARVVITLKPVGFQTEMEARVTPQQAAYLFMVIGLVATILITVGGASLSLHLASQAQLPSAWTGALAVAPLILGLVVGPMLVIRVTPRRADRDER
jgi:hypothetical protein